MTPATTRDLVLEPSDNRRLANLCGQFNQHIQQVENHLKVKIINRGNFFVIEGPSQAVHSTAKLLEILYEETEEDITLTPDVVHTILQESRVEALDELPSKTTQYSIVKTRNLLIKPRGPHQKQYVERIMNHDISFGIGPAGTGKTYLAVACAVSALEKGEVERLIIARPAVEAGERLGFLPGDLSQKVDPYLRPIYDALYEMMGVETVTKLVEKNIIEVAPLAFMRGRTLNHAFIILDEAQNTTAAQMKMFLTRIGFGAKAVITGDITQTDLPSGMESGLKQVMTILRDLNDISFTTFDTEDIVRHSLVQKVVQAYEQHQSTQRGHTN